MPHRRHLLAAGVGSALGLGFASSRAAGSSGKRPAARFVRVTDVHITAERGAP